MRTDTRLLRRLPRLSFSMLAIVMLLAGCGEKLQTVTEEKAVAVKALALSTNTLPIDLQYPGRAEGSKEVEVRARVDGILLHRRYREGEKVEAGQLLFEIDAAPFEVALDRAKAHLAQTQAALSAAERRWGRAKELIKRDAISQRERDDTQSELEMAQADVKMARAEVKEAEINLGYTQVLAPIGGITSREEVSEGSLVGPGSVLAKITQLDPIWVNISIPDSELLSFRSMLNSGDLQFEETSRRAVVETANGYIHPHSGKVNFTESAVDRQTGTVQMRAAIPNPDGTLIPGQFVRVHLEGLRSVNALAIPERAVMQNAQGSYVYRVVEGQRVQPAPVSLGLKTTAGVIVESGLESGDVIVVEGLGRVRPGSLVEIQQAQDAELEPGGADKPKASGQVSSDQGAAE